MKLLDVGLLILRIGVGTILLVVQGLPRVSSFSQMAPTFPDPLGVSPTVTLTSVIFAEVVCAAAVIVGFLTRLAAAFVTLSMAIAAVLIEGQTPEQRGVALLYLFPFLFLAMVGAGAFSVDSALTRGGD